MTTVPIEPDLEILVDDEDVASVRAHHWCARPDRERGLVVVAKMNGRHVFLHRYLTKAAAKQIVTFKNKNTLDCTRQNLVSESRSQVVRHGKVSGRNRTSRYRGVTKVSRHLSRPWQAQIRLGKKVVFLGRYADEAAAARAHDEAQRKYFGPDAILNF
jgi:hypothetical protein